MESARHRQQMSLLVDSLEDSWRERDDFYVGGNMFLYFSAAQVRNNDFRGPDVFVVLNTTRRERKPGSCGKKAVRRPTSSSSSSRRKRSASIAERRWNLRTSPRGRRILPLRPVLRPPRRIRARSHERQVRPEGAGRERATPLQPNGSAARHRAEHAPRGGRGLAPLDDPGRRRAVALGARRGGSRTRSGGSGASRPACGGARRAEGATVVLSDAATR